MSAETSQPKTRAELQVAFDLALAKLKGKYQTFVLAVLNGKNHTDAAIAAQFSEKSARKQGYRMSTNVDISTAIDLGLQLAAAHAVMEAREVLERETEIARGSLAPFLRIQGGELKGFDFSDGTPLHLLKKASVTKRTIREITEETVTIELHDPQTALTLLGKHHRLFIDRQEVTGKDGAPIEITDARTRLLDRLTRRAADADEDGPGEPALGSG